MENFLILTKHAKSRMKEQNINMAMVDYAWDHGHEIRPSIWHYLKKLCKYKHQKTVRYYKCGHLLLTVNHTVNGPVLITITRKKI
jgi:hypothetical protein